MYFSQRLKPDIQSNLLPVATEFFRIGNSKISETNEIGRKVLFRLFTFEALIFQLLRNFLASDFFLKSLGAFTAIKKHFHFLQNG